jgi:hypothetical protein
MGKKVISHFRCPKCLRTMKDSKSKHNTHHLWPQRYWHGAGPTIELCRPCHQNYNSFEADAESERLAKYGSRKFSRKEYEDLFYLWLSKTH